MGNNLYGRQSVSMGKRTFLSIGLACALFGGGIYTATESGSTMKDAFTVSADPAKAERPTDASSKSDEPVSVASAAVAVAKRSPLPMNKLAREIQWQFGGKTQRGWYLYASLIQTMV